MNPDMTPTARYNEGTWVGVGGFSSFKKALISMGYVWDEKADAWCRNLGGGLFEFVHPLGVTIQMAHDSEPSDDIRSEVGHAIGCRMVRDDAIRFSGDSVTKYIDRVSHLVELGHQVLLEPAQ